MYVGLFYHCWQCETCEGTQRAFFECHSSNLCGRSHLGCFIDFSYFPWQKFIVARRMLFMVRLFFVIWSIALVVSWSALIDQPSFIFDFQLNSVFQNYCFVFQIIHFPCYHITINISFACDQDIYRTFHSPINTTGATSGTGTAYPFGAPEFTPGF